VLTRRISRVTDIGEALGNLAVRETEPAERALELSKRMVLSGWTPTRRCWTACSSLRRTPPKISVLTGSKYLCVNASRLYS